MRPYQMQVVGGALLGSGIGAMINPGSAGAGMVRAGLLLAVFSFLEQSR